MSLGVCIGRFQFLTKAHQAIIDTALAHGQVLVIVGSAGEARSVMNPWTFEERKSMLRAVYGDSIMIDSIQDSNYDYAWWKGELSAKIKKYANVIGDYDTVLFGHASDSSSYYFLDFPHHDVGEQVDGIHATELRKCFFDWNKGCEYAKYTSEKMQNWLFAWKNHNEKEYRWLQYEFKSVEDYKEPYKSQKYPPIFVTTDAIVHCGTDVLMIKRKKHPGQDLYAFPGGHLEANETIENCVFRELQEETGLDLKSIKYVATPPVIFDSVNRDPRGRYLSNVFVFSLSCKPEVKGADDASSAEWINIKDLRADMTAFDHYKILHKMQGYTEDFRIVH